MSQKGSTYSHEKQFEVKIWWFKMESACHIDNIYKLMKLIKLNITFFKCKTLKIQECYDSKCWDQIILQLII